MDKRTEKQLREQLKKNQTTIHILSTADYLKIYSKHKKVSLDPALYTAKKVGGFVSPIIDTTTAIRLGRDLGILGKVVTKTYHGKQYIVFKGYAGLRKIFTSTKYLATNTKVIDMAIGKLGVTKTIAKGARLTAFITVPINVFNYIISDSMTMQQLIGTTATDLAKIGISSAAATGAAYVVGAVTTVALGPLVAAIAVGVIVGLVLDKLDEKFKITEALIKTIDEIWNTDYKYKTKKTLHEIIMQFTDPKKLMYWYSQ